MPKFKRVVMLMGLNAFTGWGLSTLALYFLNKSSNSSSETEMDPSDLNVGSNETKIGSPIPVVIGRCLVKSPIVSYFGDFRADKYTETYAAHANFNAWPLVFALIAQYISSPATTKGDGKGQVTSGKESGSSVTVEIWGKDMAVGPLINSLFMWLLSWLINGRNLKTTIQKGFKYFLGYQFLVCWSSPTMRIRAIYMKEQKVWEGDESRENHQTTPFSISVDDNELFGGPDENGGFIGEIKTYLGGDNQGADPWMVQQMSNDSIQPELRGLTPAYRDFVSIVVPTAYIGKSATIPETWIELQDCPNYLGLGPVGEDANPAEALYLIHTNQDWGLAESPDSIDKESLMKIGKTLAEEGIGISIPITNTTEARSLFDDICTHVNAVKYSDPITGRLTFKLIRDDYNVDEVQVVDTTNASSFTFTRLDWTQTISKISVGYTDRKAMYEESTIPAVDPANIEINNGVQTTKSYNYNYFTTAENALWAAKREINEQSYPLATGSIEGNRKLSNVRIGDVIKVNWEPYGVKNLLMRVTDVDFGDFIDGKVKIEAIEDIFGLSKTDFGFSGSTEWEKEETYPTGVQAFRYLELPWEICQCNDTYVSAFAAKPDVKTQTWTVWRQQQNTPFQSTNSMSNWSATGRLVYDIAEFSDVEDILGFEIADLGGIEELESSNIADISVARKGSRLLVIDDEIVSYSTLAQLPNGHWYVKGVMRGVFDTVPRKHFAQTNVFFIRSSYYANVTTGGPVCREGNIVTEQYNITTSTVDHDEEMDYTKTKQLTTTRRPELPSVPGKIRMAAHLQADQYHTDKIAGDLSMSFIPRNKRQSFGCVSQNDEIEYWTKQDLVAEAGTDYIARVTVAGVSKDYTIDSSPFTYTWEQRCNDFNSLNEKTMIELYARKGELLSYQAQERSFDWTIPTLVNCVASESDCAALLANWSIVDRVVIPDGDLATQKQIMFTDMPIVILGEKVSAGTANAICSYDGDYFVANGQIMIVTGKNTYELYTMQPGYVFRSYFVPTATGGSMYYEWDGTKIIERVM